MNSMQLKDKIKNIARSKDVDFNIVFRLYMYDRFIERLTVSKYKDNFILKGGFYLSIIFGIENRATMDIDTAIKNINFTEDNIKRIIEDILNIDIQDNARLELLGISPIRQEDEYGGYRATIIVKLENIREMFQIDIATGDPITPKAIRLKYSPILKDKTINLWSYNIETILAEKLETILTRAEASSRTRDYYDIYLIYKMYFKNINIDHYRQAVKNTFKKRGYNGDIIETVNLIKESDILKTRWQAYSRKYKYARNINYSEVMECLDKIVEVLELTINI